MAVFVTDAVEQFGAHIRQGETMMNESNDRRVSCRSLIKEASSGMDNLAAFLEQTAEKMERQMAEKESTLRDIESEYADKLNGLTRKDQLCDSEQGNLEEENRSVNSEICADLSQSCAEMQQNIENAEEEENGVASEVDALIPNLDDLNEQSGNEESEQAGIKYEQDSTNVQMQEENISFQASKLEAERSFDELQRCITSAVQEQTEFEAALVEHKEIILNYEDVEFQCIETCKFMQEELDSNIPYLEEMSNATSIMTKNREHLQQKVSDCSVASDRLRSDLLKRRDQIVALKAKQQEEKTALENGRMNLDTWKTKSLAVSSEIELLEKDLCEIQERLSSSFQGKAEAKETLNECLKERSRIQAELSALNQSNAVAQQQIHSLEQALSALKADICQRQVQEAEVKANVFACAEQLTALTANLSMQDEEISNYLEELDKLVEMGAELEVERDNQEKAIEVNFDEAKREYQVALSPIERQLTELEKQQQKLELELQDLDRKMYKTNLSSTSDTLWSPSTRGTSSVASLTSFRSPNLASSPKKTIAAAASRRTLPRMKEFSPDLLATKSVKKRTLAIVETEDDEFDSESAKLDEPRDPSPPRASALTPRNRPIMGPPAAAGNSKRFFKYRETPPSSKRVLPVMSSGNAKKQSRSAKKETKKQAEVEFDWFS